MLGSLLRCSSALLICHCTHLFLVALSHSFSEMVWKAIFPITAFASLKPAIWDFFVCTVVYSVSEEGSLKIHSEMLSSRLSCSLNIVDFFSKYAYLLTTMNFIICRNLIKPTHRECISYFGRLMKCYLKEK